VQHLNPSRPVTVAVRQRSLRFLAELNEKYLHIYPRERELETHIENYELAARMQIAAADIGDISGESAATRKLYGLDDKSTVGCGLRALMARCLVEVRVRFIEVFAPLTRTHSLGTRTSI